MKSILNTFPFLNVLGSRLIAERSRPRSRRRVRLTGNSAPIGGLVGYWTHMWVCVDIRRLRGPKTGALSRCGPADTCGLTHRFFSHSKLGGTRESSKP